jgi:type IV pilus assembly protein PilY1
MNLDDQQVNLQKVNNVMFGIKDYSFPNFGTANNTQSPDNFLKCNNTTNDITGASCPDIGDRGWYVELDKQKKVVNEPTLKGNIVYYPLYRPANYFDPLRPNFITTLNQSCGGGNAYICAVDGECGSNKSNKIGNINQGEQCLYVGTGILSKIVAFGLNLYANISGESTNADKTDIVIIESISENVQAYRSSWRDNY